MLLDVVIPGDIPKCLWPNARCHYMAKWKQSQYVKSLAQNAVLNAGPLHVEDQPVRVQWTLALGKGKRPRDIDNTIAACKALQDGVFDALGIDDKWVVEVGVAWITKQPESSVRCQVSALTRGSTNSQSG